MVGSGVKSQIKRRLRKANTNKIIGKITYSPKKHKQALTKKLRRNLQTKDPIVHNPVVEHVSIKFGSININGLDMEAGWAVEQLIAKKKLDVS